jgi:hypothetical protein
MNHEKLYKLMLLAVSEYDINGRIRIPLVRQIERVAMEAQADRGEREDYDYQKWVDLWNEYSKAHIRITNTKRQQIRQRLKTFSEKEIEAAIRYRFEDEWINSKGLAHRDSWDAIWRSDEKMEHWLVKSGQHSEGNPEKYIDDTHPIQRDILFQGFTHLSQLKWLTLEECESLERNFSEGAIMDAIMTAHYEAIPGDSAYEVLLGVLEGAHV